MCIRDRSKRLVLALPFFFKYLAFIISSYHTTQVTELTNLPQITLPNSILNLTLLFCFSVPMTFCKLTLSSNL